MKRIALIAALAASVAAPAFAQSASAIFATQHLNLSIDSPADRITLPAAASVATPIEEGSSLERALQILNRSADGPSELIGTQGATIVSGTPAFAADIFERLRAADDNN